VSLACILALIGKNHLVDIALFPDYIPDLNGVGHFCSPSFFFVVESVYILIIFMSTDFLLF